MLAEVISMTLLSLALTGAVWEEGTILGPLHGLVVMPKGVEQELGFAQD